MTTESENALEAPETSVEMPRPTTAPIIVSLGAVLLAAGVPFGAAFLVAGALPSVSGLGLWGRNLSPGRGHCREPLAGAAEAVASKRQGVEQLYPGMPGYRIHLPEKVHPISAGIRGGLVGGLVMPLPALIWGIFSDHGIWYPVNLLAG